MNDYNVSYYVYLYGKHKPICEVHVYKDGDSLTIAKRICELTRMDDRLLQGYRITHVVMAYMGDLCESLENHYIWNTDTTDEHKKKFEEFIAERISTVIAKVKEQHTMHCLTIAS